MAATVFGFHAVALYVRDHEGASYSDPQNELLPLVDLKLAANQTETGVSTRDGLHVIPLKLGMRSLGVLAVTGGEYSLPIGGWRGRATS